jgi:MOSC domain-containing protein YiiM
MAVPSGADRQGAGSAKSRDTRVVRGTVLQVSVSRGGIPKRAIAEGDVGPLGIAGDGHGHPEIHGGPQQAILLLSSEVIAGLTAQGYALYPGALGENITTDGIDCAQWRTGQRWRIGAVIVELTTVRVPCSQLNVYGPGIQKTMYDAQVQAGDPSSPRWAMSGFYASIVHAGPIRPGDPILLLDQMV